MSTPEDQELENKRTVLHQLKGELAEHELALVDLRVKLQVSEREYLNTLSLTVDKRVADLLSTSERQQQSIEKKIDLLNLTQDQITPRLSNHISQTQENLREGLSELRQRLSEQIKQSEQTQPGWLLTVTEQINKLVASQENLATLEEVMQLTQGQLTAISTLTEAIKQIESKQDSTANHLEQIDNSNLEILFLTTDIAEQVRCLIRGNEESITILTKRIDEVSQAQDSTTKYLEQIDKVSQETQILAKDVSAQTSLLPQHAQEIVTTLKEQIGEVSQTTGSLVESSSQHQEKLEHIRSDVQELKKIVGQQPRTIQTLRCMCVLKGSSGCAKSIVFSPNTLSLASRTEETIKQWDLKTGELLQVLDECTRSIAFSAKGEFLATGSSEDFRGAVTLWDLKAERLTKSDLENSDLKHLDYVNSIAFSPIDSLFASGSSDKTIVLWNLQTRKPDRTLNGHSRSVRRLTFSPVGQRLASGSSDGTIKLWNLETGESTHTLTQHSDWISSIAFSPDGQLLASGSGDKTIILWDLKTEELNQVVLLGHSYHVYSVAFSPDGQTLVSGGGDGTVKLWDVKTRELRQMFAVHSGSVNCVAFSPDGQLLVSENDNETIRIWRLFG